MGKFLTSKSGFSELLAFLQKVPQTASGQYLGSFRSFLGSFLGSIWAKKRPTGLPNRSL